MTTFHVRPLVEGTTLPMLFEAAGAGLFLGASLPAMRETVERHLCTGGGVLFRGFSLDGADAFRAFAADFGHPLLAYEVGSTPRSQVTSGVYTSTESPPHQHIPLHNEQAYARDERASRSRRNREALSAFDFAAFSSTNRYPLRRKML